MINRSLWFMFLVLAVILAARGDIAEALLSILIAELLELKEQVAHRKGK